MKKFLSAFLFLTACHGVPSYQIAEDLNSPEQTSVVGGQVVPASHHLQQQALLFKAFHSKIQVDTGEAIETRWKTGICTASALTPRILITAAHCYNKDAEFHRVEFPVDDNKIAPYKALKVIPHPDYEKDPAADLAIVLLEFALPESVRLVKLPSTSPLQMKVILAAGYGRNDGRRNQPGGAGTLRAALLDIDNYDSSAPTFSVEQRFGKGICQGDSGGPAIVHINGKDTVVGVVSKTQHIISDAEDQDICGYKGVYVNVQHFLDWIEPTVRDLKYE